MKSLITQLDKRKSLLIKFVFVFAFCAIIFNLFFVITPPTYFNGKYNLYFVYGLFIYKLIELSILYYILMHRHICFLRENQATVEYIEKLRKQTKLLLFLVIQGNTVFGIIAFKFSGQVLFFLIFSSIALIALLIIKPNKLLL